MYQYGGQYGGPQMPPGYAGYPAQGGPPGVGPPPGMGQHADGGAPPGMAPAALNSAQPGLPGRPGFAQNFQPPANMSNINFAAPVIRLGTGAQLKPGLGQAFGGDGRGRPGLGMDQAQRPGTQQTTMLQLNPPTKDETLRTVFVRNIGEKTPDVVIERVLRSVGNLRRFIRVLNADLKQSACGFAEYEDWGSFGLAIEVLKEVELKIPTRDKAGAIEGYETINMEMVIDENSTDRLEEYNAANGSDPVAEQSRMDSSRRSLEMALADIADPSTVNANFMVDMHDDMNQGDIVTIAITGDDELSEIPAEMRESVAAEITAFRDRSNRRDLERMKREEEMEAIDRARSGNKNRLGSPGPSSGTNGIPLKAKDREPANAPLGPKAYTGSQLPRDYQKGVSFVNGAGGDPYALTKEEEDTDASDSEVERRRKARRTAHDEKLFQDQERKWLSREKRLGAAVDRERGRDLDDKERQERDAKIMAKRLREWDDDAEAARKVDEYFADHSTWLRSRQAFRAREAEADDRDRELEGSERAKDNRNRESAKDFADQFLDKQAEELSRVPREPQRFKLSLGAAAQKAQAQAAAAQPKRTMAEVEGLLEDEADAEPATKRTLIPIKYEGNPTPLSLTEEEKEQAVRQLAQDIPNDKDGLWSWVVKWKFLDDTIIKEKLRPFVEKKIMDYLGVQEEMLVDVVEEHLRKHGSATELVAELEMALDEEAEVLVKKLWRMVIFFTESESRDIR